MTRSLRVAQRVLFFAVYAASFWLAAQVAIFCAGAQTLQLLIYSVLLALPLFLLFVLGIESGRLAWRGWLILALVVSLIPLTMLPWHPRLRFTQLLGSLRDGTSLAEVKRIMAGYYGGEVFEVGTLHGEPRVPDVATHMLAYRWNEDDWQYNADIGEVFLANGKVVGTEFLPD